MLGSSSSSPRIVGQLVERELDLEHDGRLADRRPGPGRRRPGDSRTCASPGFAVALTDATGCFVAETQLGDVDVRERESRRCLSPACRAARPLLRCTCGGSALNPTADDLAEPGMILRTSLNSQRRCPLGAPLRRPSRICWRHVVQARPWRRRFAVAVVLLQPVLHDVDLVLRVLVDDGRTRGSTA